MLPPLSTEQVIERTVREEWGRILASLASGLNDLQLAEDCLQEAVISAMDHWGRNGLPRSPSAWLIIVARRKALDKLRRAQNFARKENEIAYLLELENRPLDDPMTETIPDKRLEMIFTCCHPALERKSQVALTLRTLGGLSTDEIAAAFLDKPSSMQKRITRAKQQIARGGIPYEVPQDADLPERISTVLSVLYLIFNEGYSANSGTTVLRSDLSGEAIRLTRIIVALLPNDCEAAGLLALMLLHDSRRNARVGPAGEIIALEDQNRKRWDREKIQEGVAILKETLPKQGIGPYQIQAAISAVHAQSPAWEQTDWAEIVALYELLFAMQPTSVVQVNLAVAVSYAQTPDAALVIMEKVATAAKIQSYQPYYAAMGNLLARAGRITEAKVSFENAIELSENAQEIAFLKNAARRLLH
ncbi:MAG: RNA polymerase sigma factor [Ascidiaceihabitans sp.]|jgi:RNA polymerase sigma-70 factor (ECF subfamily)|nr:RNA polymerase sigma factor [Ascidiaceihabitans sp.]